MISRHIRSLPFVASAWMLLVASGHARADDFRTWTDSSGAHKRVAAFQKLEGDSVYLRTKEGKVTKVPLQKLSDADQSYAKNAALTGSPPDPFTDSAEIPSRTEQSVAEVPQADEALQPADPNLRLVTAEGVGANIDKAKKDAYREAVRQVVGAYVDSSQLLQNDKLIEDRIITLSSAFVERASPPLTTTTEDGVVRVKVKAWVRLTKVLETLKQSNVILKVDNTSFTAEMQTKADQSEGEDAIMSRVFENFPANSFKASVGKPEIKKASGTGAVIRVTVKLEPDLEQYLLVAQKIDAALGSTGHKQGQFSVDGKKFPPNASPEILRYWKQNGEGAVVDLIRSSLPEGDHARLKKETRDYECASVHIPSFFHFWPGEGSSLGLGELTYGKWSKIRGGAENIVFLVMTKSNPSCQRTQWKWYLLPKEDARRWFALACKTMKCTLSFLDDSSNELLDDSFSLSGLGWLVHDVHSRGELVYVCSPFFVHGSCDWYAPSFTYTRQIDVDATEITGLSAVRCSLVNGDVPDRVWGVRN